MKLSVTKRYTLHYSTYRKYLVKLKETENRMVVARGQGWWKIASYLLSIEFQFCVMKKFWKLLYNNVNIFNTVGLYIKNG